MLASSEDQVEVSIHKELLCFFSPYYAAALNGNFSEAQKNRFEVDLLGRDLESFATWIYTGYLQQGTQIGRIVTLYIFADQVDIMALRRDALGQLSRLDGPMPNYRQVKQILKNLTQHSQLYLWTLKCYINHWVASVDAGDPCPLESDSDPDNLLAQFIYQVMKGVTLRRERDAPGCVCCNDPCQYHEHASKAEWEASKLSQSARSRYYCLLTIS